MAVEAVFGAETVWHCEIDDAASKVLAHRWPDVPNHRDLINTDWSAVEPIDILCAGWPCQPFSLAGKRKGADDERAIWPHIADAVRVLRPRIIVLENVTAVLAVEFGRVADSLAALGYDLRWTSLRASDVGAPHRRERLFVVAHTEGIGRGVWDTAHHRQADREVDASADNRGAAADSSRVGRDEGRPESAGIVGGSDVPVSGDGPVELLPTPSTHDKTGARSPESIARMDKPFANLNDTAVNLLSTPQARDSKGVPKDAFNTACLPRDIIECDISWGKYEVAIKRWESMTRPAPTPTIPGVAGLRRPRLNPAFSEWMMGWPDGWVTDVPGISRNDMLRIIGNGVVPQCAGAAIRWLLNVSEVAA